MRNALLKSWILATLLVALGENAPVAAQDTNEKIHIEQVVEGLSPVPPDIRLPNENELRLIGLTLRRVSDPSGSSFRLGAYKRLIEQLSAIFGPSHPLTARVGLGYARELIEAQNYQAAAAQLDAAEEIIATRLPTDHVANVSIKITRMLLLDLSGNHIEQYFASQRLEEFIRQEHPNNDDLRIAAANAHSVALYRLGRFAEASDIGAQIIDELTAIHGERSAKVVSAVIGQSLNLLSDGRLEKAESLIQARGATAALDPDKDSTLIARLYRAQAAIKEAKLDFDGARDSLQSAYDIFSAARYRSPNIVGDINPDYATVSATRTAFDLERLTQRKHPTLGLTLPGWGSHWAKVEIEGEEFLSSSIDKDNVWVIQNRLEAMVAKNIALHKERSGWNFAPAEHFWRAIIEFTSQGTGADSVRTAAARIDLSENLLKQRKPFAAAEEAAAARSSLNGKLSFNHPLVVRALSVEALALSSQGRREQAKIAIDAALGLAWEAKDQAKAQLLELLIERDRLLQLDGYNEDRQEFWEIWGERVGQLNLYGAFAQIEQSGKAVLAWMQAQTNAGSCPPVELRTQLRKSAAGFRIEGEDGQQPFIPAILLKSALLLDQSIVETLACGEEGPDAVYAFLEEITNSQRYAFVTESGPELVSRLDRWADLLMRDPAFGDDQERTQLAFQFLSTAESIAQNQIANARGAGADLDSRQRRILAGSGVGFEYRFALETRLRANWRFAQARAKKAEGDQAFFGVTTPMNSDGFDEAFNAAQLLRIDRNSQTLALASARAAAPNPELREIVGRYQELGEVLFTMLDAPQPDDNRLRAAQAEYATLDARIQTEFPNYYEFAAPSPLGYWDARRALDYGEGLLTILTVGDDVYVFAISRSFGESRAWNRIQGGAEEIATMVALLRCDIDPVECGSGAAVQARGGGPEEAIEGWEGFSFDRNLAWELYNRLIRPVAHVFEQQESYEEPTERLYAVTSGAISALPLSVLLTAPPSDDGLDTTGPVFRDAPWLTNRFDIAYLPAVSDLRGTVREKLNAQGLTGYGDPVLSPPSSQQEASERGANLFRGAGAAAIPQADPSELRKLKSLPGAAAELAAVAALFPDGGRLVTRDSATELTVKADEGLAGSQVILFSTHGVLPDPRSSISEAGLVMTPPGEATLLDDGLLSASEAAALDFTSELLVLSACNTASAGSLTGADSLSGLARSFIFAGARSVYASHWRVSDNITKELVLLAIDYALKYPGLTRSEALRKAMTSIRTGRREDGSLIEEWTPDWSHPSAWAPFVTITTLERKTSSEMS